MPWRQVLSIPRGGDLAFGDQREPFLVSDLLQGACPIRRGEGQDAMQSVQQRIWETLAAVSEQNKKRVSTGSLIVWKSTPVELHVGGVWRQKFLQKVEIYSAHEGAIHEVPDVLRQAKPRVTCSVRVLPNRHDRSRIQSAGGVRRIRARLGRWWGWQSYPPPGRPIPTSHPTCARSVPSLPRACCGSAAARPGNWRAMPSAPGTRERFAYTPRPGSAVMPTRLVGERHDEAHASQSPSR